MEQKPGKRVLKKLFFFVSIFQSVLISTVLLLFPNPTIFNESFSPSAKKIAAIFLAEALIWPLFVFFISKYYKPEKSRVVTRSIRYLLMGPYLIIGGILILSFSAGPKDRGKYIGYWWSQFGGRGADAYENDKKNRTDTIVVFIVSGLMILGGAGSSVSGFKTIRMLDNISESTKIENDEKKFLTANSLTEQEQKLIKKSSRSGCLFPLLGSLIGLVIGGITGYIIDRQFPPEQRDVSLAIITCGLIAWFLALIISVVIFRIKNKSLIAQAALLKEKWGKSRKEQYEQEEKEFLKKHSKIEKKKD